MPVHVINEAYEDLLVRLTALWVNHGVVITDAHSDNLCPCNVQGRLFFYILDGKLAGPNKDACSALYRLRIKLKCESVRNHKWLLNKYINALEG
jgi:hypothetical protein